MRLKISEHKALIEIIEKMGFATAEFEFRKKAGVLHISHSKLSEPFSFYRKKITRISSDKKWEDQELYFTHLPHRGGKEISWEALLKAFERHLDQMKN